jgi:hypothetical protein
MPGPHWVCGTTGCWRMCYRDLAERRNRRECHVSAHVSPGNAPGLSSSTRLWVRRRGLSATRPEGVVAGRSRHRQLPNDAAAIGADHSRGHRQQRRNLVDRLPPREQPHDFELAIGERPCRRFRAARCGGHSDRLAHSRTDVANRCSSTSFMTASRACWRGPAVLRMSLSVRSKTPPFHLAITRPCSRSLFDRHNLFNFHGRSTRTSSRRHTWTGSQRVSRTGPGCSNGGKQLK